MQRIYPILEAIQTIADDKLVYNDVQLTSSEFPWRVKWLCVSIKMESCEFRRDKGKYRQNFLPGGISYHNATQTRLSLLLGLAFSGG